MKYAHVEYVPIFKALADETRLKIVEMLSCDEMCACHLLEYFHISQSTLSYHMKVLTRCGLIDGRRDGSWMRYKINREKAAIVREFWDYISTEQETCICKDFKGSPKC